MREGILTMLKIDGRKRSVHIASTITILTLVNGASLFFKVRAPSLRSQQRTTRVAAHPPTPAHTDNPYLRPT